MENPQVSVVIPVHNRRDQLKRAVRSVWDQSYKNFELIVVDDGSTEWDERFEERMKEKGARVLHTPQAGVSRARNLGARSAEGEWLAFLDSDDEWLSEKLEKQLSFLASNPEFKIAQSNERWIRQGMFVNKRAHHQLGEGDCFELSLKQCCISPSSVILDREYFLSLEGFDERLKACEDYDLWLRITHQQPVLLIHEELIVKHGGHEDQLSRSVPALDRLRAFAILKLLLSVELSSERRSQSLEHLREKLQIFLLGAEKRPDSKAKLFAEWLYGELCLEKDLAELADLEPKLNSLLSLTPLSEESTAE